MCKVKVNWDEIKPSKTKTRGGFGGKNKETKIYLDHLPKGGGLINKNAINWSQCIGYYIPFLYGDYSGELLIKNYYKKQFKTGALPRIIIEVVGWGQEFDVGVDTILYCRLGYIVNSVLNPQYKYRDLIINSVGFEKAKKLTIYYNDKIELICPNCNKTHKRTLSDLTTQGFSCPYCKDGLSYAERLFNIILKQMNIDYITQKRFSNKTYKYDIYIPSLNIIIELHGKQHYKEFHRQPNWKSYDDEHENDMIKYDIAVLNGYEYNKNYFVIDCRYSNCDYIKNNLENNKVYSLLKTIAKNDIDWDKASKDVELSLVKQVCNYYNKFNCSANEIKEALELSISYGTICKYLNIGNDLGLCKYNGKENQRQIVSKPCVCLDKNSKELIFIKDSCKDMGILLGLKSVGKVSDCCNYHHNPIEYMKTHKQVAKTVKGYICMYYEDYLKLQNELNELN